MSVRIRLAAPLTVESHLGGRTGSTRLDGPKGIRIKSSRSAIRGSLRVAQGTPAAWDTPEDSGNALARNQVLAVRSVALAL